MRRIALIGSNFSDHPALPFDATLELAGKAACAPSQKKTGRQGCLRSQPKNMNEQQPKGWYSRGYLPHFDGGEMIQFITYRLADSLPQKILKCWQI